MVWPELFLPEVTRTYFHYIPADTCMNASIEHQTKILLNQLRFGCSFVHLPSFYTNYPSMILNYVWTDFSKYFNMHFIPKRTCTNPVMKVTMALLSIFSTNQYLSTSCSLSIFRGTADGCNIFFQLIIDTKRFLIYLLYGSHLMLFLRIGVVCSDEAVKPRHAYSLSQAIA